jgi:hypothetical protein
MRNRNLYPLFNSPSDRNIFPDFAIEQPGLSTSTTLALSETRRSKVRSTEWNCTWVWSTTMPTSGADEWLDGRL